MGMKKWCVKACDKELAKLLAEECDVDSITALIAAARGYTDPSQLEQFLSDEAVLADPHELADIDKAANIINGEIEKGGLIAVYGDYDCDGIMATAMLYNYLLGRGANCIYYIPDRFDEGYGMNLTAVDNLHNQGVSLIITVDNGIASIEEIKKAKEYGIKVVVTDHHLPQDELPPADAVVNPHRRDCPSAFKEICGTEVAFKLICVLEDREAEELLPYFADLVATALIADVMPLIDENRTIVKYGIAKLKSNAATGLSALMGVSGISKNDISAERIAFAISPRINAAGRMGKAQRALDLLCENNMLKALEIAEELDKYNAERQQIEKKISQEAFKIIDENGYYNNRVIVVAGENWHHGVVGIVASRIVDKYGVPAVVISCDGETATGSGRSIEGFHLYNAFKSCENSLIKFGGHELAGGLSLKTEDIERFREEINLYAMGIPVAEPKLYIDCRLKPSALNLDLADALSPLKPYGVGNPIPVFGLYNVTLQKITPIGNGKHLRLIFTKDNVTFQCLLFGVAEENFCFALGEILDLAVTIESKIYNGEYNLSVVIKAIRVSGIDDEKLFQDITNCRDFFSGLNVNSSSILPTREEVGEIYKSLSKPMLEDRIKYLFINKIGYGKTVIAIKVLEELGLISKKENGMYGVVPNAPKNNLINSKTFKILTERSSNNE